MDLSVDLTTSLSRLGIPDTWRVFFLCLLATAFGVGIYLFVFPLSGQFNFIQTVALGVIVAFAMMGLNYAAKYSNTATRDLFTPVDILNYTVQGFAWPALWPSLAQAVGAVVIEPLPPATNLLIELLRMLA